MNMKRGEMIGFNGCLGYDYHPEDKSITVNSEEAEIVCEIFDLYLRGYGAPMIAKKLTGLECPLIRQGKSTAGNMPSAVCVNVDFVGSIRQGVPTIRQQHR